MFDICHATTNSSSPNRRAARSGVSVGRLVAVAGLAVGLAHESAAAQVVAGPIEHGGHVYYLVGPGGWNECEAQATAIAGHLATINDAAEQAWVYSTFNGATRYLWIGLRDAGSNGVFTWVDGTPVGYTNWGCGQPDDGDDGTGGRNEDFAHMLPAGFTYHGCTAVGGEWNDWDGDGGYGVVEVPCITPPSTSTWTGAANDNDLWDTPGNWSPSGRPADNAGAAFDLPGARTIVIPPNRTIGLLDVRQGAVNLIVSSGQLSNPTTGCVPPGGSLGIGNTSQTASCSLLGNLGDFSFNRLTIVGYGPNSTASLSVQATTLRTTSGVVVGLGDASQATLTLDGGSLLQSGSFGVVCGSGDGTTGTINVLNGATLRYSSATPFKVGYGAGSHGTVNVAGDFQLTSSLIPAGADSQILLGAGSPPPGGVITTGTINLHTRGLVRATEIRLGAEPRTRGTITMDGGTLDVQSLVIADKSDGTLDWSGGTITGLRQITIGNTAGNSGQLLLDGPSHSLTLAAPIGGETQNLYAGKTGRGRIELTNGAAINLSSGSLGGLSIGATDPSGGGGVKIIGHAPGNPYFRSRIVGGVGSVLNVGRQYTVPFSVPALLLDGGRATFGSILVGREDWMDGEIQVSNHAVLQQIRPGADAFGSNDGLQVRGTPTFPTGARLLVDTGGQVQCTSGIAFNTYDGGPVITVTGAGSTLNCSGPFYVAGDLPTGGKMRVESGATVTSRDFCIARGGGIGLPGELTLSGPGQVLDVTGTLFVGMDSEPTAAGRLILQNGAHVRTHRLALGDNQSITTDVAGPPAILVGGSPGVPPDIQCDTLIVEDTFTPPGLDITFGAGAGIGGHATWPHGFDNVSGCEVIASQGSAVSETIPNEPPNYVTKLTIAGDYFQDAASMLNVSCGIAVGGESQYPVNSKVVVQGRATVGGVVRFDKWTRGWSTFVHDTWADQFAVGKTYSVLIASEVDGSFDRIEFGPGFVTNRAQLTYEPTRVLVTFLPPVCETIIQTQPTDQATCTQGDAAFSIVATGPDGFGAPVSYQWQHFIPSNGSVDWVSIEDGTNVSQIGALYAAAGSQTPTLALTIDPAFNSEGGNPQVPIRCVVTSACGETVSDVATLAVWAADFDCDGFVTGDDFDAFLAAFELGEGAADFNLDGFVTGEDFDAYVAAFEAGC